MEKEVASEKNQYVKYAESVGLEGPGINKVEEAIESRHRQKNKQLEGQQPQQEDDG